MRRIVLVFIVLVLVIIWTQVCLAQPPPPPDLIIVGLDNISITTALNPTSGMMEGSGNDPFQVKIWLSGATSGSVSITSVTCPVTKQTAAGSAVGYLTAFLSRNDLILSGLKTTDVVLTVWIKVPLTVPAGTYTGGVVQITATASF